MKCILYTAFFLTGLTTGGLLFSQTPYRFVPVDAFPQGLGCNYAGTATIGPLIGQSNDIIPDTIFLCFGDSVFVDHNGDYNIACDPVPSTPTGLGWAFYQCPPTWSCDSLQPLVYDPCLWPGAPNGMFYNQGDINGDTWLWNSGALITSAIFGHGDPVQIFFAPVTIDNIWGGSEEGPGSCANVNKDAAFSAVYLKPISPTIFISDFGNDCIGRFRPRGGLPEWDISATYDVEISLHGNSAVKGLPHHLSIEWKHGADFIFSVPEPGWYDVSVRDGKSCGASFLVDMTGCDASDNLFLSLPGVTAKPGTSVCLPLTVKNALFSTVSFSLSWDPAVLNFKGIQKVHPGLQDYDIQVLADNATEGKAGFVLSNPLSTTAPDIPDGAALFECCFEVIAPGNAVSAVKIDQSQTNIFAETPAGQRQAISVHDGTVIVKPFVAGPPKHFGNARLSPNPVVGGSPAWLSWQAPEPGNIAITISDLSGRLISEARAPVVAGLNRIEIPTAKLTTGCYWVYCRDSNGHLTQPEMLVVGQ